MSLTWFMPGATTDTTATVVAETTNPATSCRIAYSTSAALSSPTYSAPATSDSLGYVKVSLTGLTPGTRYYFQIEIGGALTTTRTGRFCTDAAAPGVPASFTFGYASCAMTDSNHPVFNRIAARNLSFFGHLGDRDYLNTASVSESSYLNNIRRAFTLPNQQACWESVAFVHMYDDHDGGGDNADRTKPGWAARAAAYRRTVPHYPLAGPEAAYQSFTKNGWHFILTDLRYARSPDTDTDDATKTMLGATQKTWLLAELQYAKDNGLVPCWLNTNVWPVTQPFSTRDQDLDHWGAFSTERTEISNYLADNNIQDVVILAGDAHMLAYGTFDFSTAQNCPVRVFQAAAMDYDHGIVRGSGWSELYSASMGNYATVEVVADPATNYSVVTWKGWHVDAVTGDETLIMSSQFSVGTPPTRYVRDVCTYDATLGEWLPRPVYLHDGQIAWEQQVIQTT